MALNNLIASEWEEGKTQEAMAKLVDLTAKMRKVAGSDSARTLELIANLGNMYEAEGDYETAKPLLQEAHDGWRNLFGEEYPRVLKLRAKLDKLAE